MKLALSPREQRIVLLGGAGVLFAVWVYSVYLVGPLLREGANLGQQVRSVREQLNMLESTAASEARLRQQQQQLSQTVESLRGQLPTEAQIPAVIEHLSDLASQTGVKIQAIFPQRPVGTPDSGPPSRGKVASQPLVYKEIPIQIDALAGYHQLGAFLSFVETGEKPMQVTSLRIAATQKEIKRQTIKLLLRLYFAVTEEASAI